MLSSSSTITIFFSCIFFILSKFCFPPSNILFLMQISCHLNNFLDSPGEKENAGTNSFL
ncbi:MAG: hypothetical protein GQ545_04040 [Candidatus Aminicenantes bacterium]|nr:hypothetical protein [Candidatus Aminicenantes bacterium]